MCYLFWLELTVPFALDLFCIDLIRSGAIAFLVNFRDTPLLECVMNGVAEIEQFPTVIPGICLEMNED